MVKAIVINNNQAQIEILLDKDDTLSGVQVPPGVTKVQFQNEASLDSAMNNTNSRVVIKKEV